MVQGLSDRKILIIGGLVIALTASLAYLPALQGGYSWEDLLLLMLAKNTWSLAQPGNFFTVSYNNLFTPLSNLIFWLEYQLFGELPAGYFAFSVVLHIVNALLICLLVYLLARKPYWAVLAGVLYAAAYPVQEAVGWIAAYVHVLAGFFYLGSLLFCLLWLRSGRYGWLAACLGFLLLGALTKEDMVTAAFFLTVLVVLVFRDSQLNRREQALGLAGILAIGMIYFLWLLKLHFSSTSQTLEAGGLSIDPAGLLNYRYLVALLLPPPDYIPLAALLNRLLQPGLAQLYSLAWLLLVPLAVWFGWVLVKGTPGERAAVLLILIAFAPFSMVQSGFSQRYLYIPYMGFAILVGLTLARTYPDSFPRWVILAAAVFVILNILATWTWQLRVNRDAAPKAGQPVLQEPFRDSRRQ